ncbi:MAG: FGGY family carbohydrate kinase [Kiritimatiellia bacterium]|jgi:sugar (pentulose or hexulose) kinase|nr:FGGY family carbohydrate kinase [Kiritimatiellia bacterium]
MTKNIIAIDIGTQSSRASVVTQDGEILGVKQIAHDLDSPKPSWAQQNPDSWWEETCQALQAVLQETGIDKSSIAAVCSCGQMSGPVGIDEAGIVTTPWVQLWCDKRCSEQCEDMLKKHDELELLKHSANPIVPAWTGIKVRWHKDHELEAYNRTRWFLVPKDFINYRLTGVPAADPSEMSCSFVWDCETEAYSQDLADAVGVDLDKFAPIHPSHEVVGEVTEEASSLTGIPAGTPVVAGGGDFPVSMLGFGIVGDGVTADVTGTSTLLAAHTKKPLLDVSIQNLRHVVDGWIPFTILDCGGMSMKWCKDLVSSMRGKEVSYDELIAMASEAPAGSDGLTFYPYMLGERRRENTTSRGGYFGITLNHAAPHFVRAVMEGVALTMGKDILDFKKQGHEVKHLMSVGGGTRNELWNEIKASITGAPLELSEEPEAGLKGAALLGAAGVGLIGDLTETAIERRAETRIVEPDGEMAEKYREVQAEYTRIYKHMLGFWQES